uniref:Phospholipase A2 n=1 Tax=Tetranychus urticae TaxID=32264 RepID=T1KX48_TETUR
MESSEAKVSPLQNSNTFLSINNSNTHQSVINTISYNDKKSINSDFLSATSSPNQNNNNDLISSVHRSLRVKRGLIQLASMIRCVSGCEPFQYKGYGCFCGLFGSGKPVDPIDKCCLKHDQCYAMAPCHQLLLYLMPYSWDCVAPALTDYEQSKDKCGFSLCECDRVFAECISKYPCPSSKAKCPYKPMVFMTDSSEDAFMKTQKLS